MRLIFIRHGDPDYVNDCLTTKGRREAACLAERVKNWKIKDIYLSPMGRAQETASYSLKALHRDGITLDWLQEFWHPITDPVTGRKGVPWDFMPEYFTSRESFYDRHNWFDTEVLATNPDLKAAALQVYKEWDSLLASYGYIRDGGIYRTASASQEQKDCTLVFFCHLGVSLLLLGYLFGISPSVLWQTIFVAPTSVTIVDSEERIPGVASFRAQVIGDTTHLHDGKEPISSAGFFGTIAEL